MNRLRHSIEQAYVKAWESFAGKPYIKPPKLSPGTIRDTVEDAQDLLYSLHNGAIVRWISDYYTRKTARREARYPMLFGELCIEAALADAYRAKMDSGFRQELNDVRRATYCHENHARQR